jgi:PEP-CTERM motif
MRLSNDRFVAFVLLTICFIESPVFALNYTESVNGDFSNDRLSPTLWGSLQTGTNTLIGTTNSSDLDYFTINIPTGSNLAGLKMVSFDGGDSGDETAFIGIEIGTQMTVPPDTQTAAGLLGWSHFGPGVGNVGLDILPFIGSQDFGSTGFVPPLPSNNYTFWIQQLGFDATTYQFDFMVTGPPAGVLGDYNGNGTVDAADYDLWRKGGPLQNEVNVPGTVSPEDYMEWRTRFGNSNSASGLSQTAVPEPSSMLLFLLGVSMLVNRRRKAALFLEIASDR